MNRDSGTTEEKLEIFTSEEKKVVYNVMDTIIYRDKHETKMGVSDWMPVLKKRGFEGMVDDFLRKVTMGSVPSGVDQLLTHKVCEEIVSQLDATT
jgi:virulence factor